ncbi:unnamed protein product, partial [Ixodes pacificus]
KTTAVPRTIQPRKHGFSERGGGAQALDCPRILCERAIWLSSSGQDRGTSPPTAIGQQCGAVQSQQAAMPRSRLIPSCVD